MRTHISGGITLTYPDNFCFSKNRNIITIEGATAYSTFTIFGDTRDLIDGYGEFNVGQYFQAGVNSKINMFSYTSFEDKEVYLDEDYFFAMAFDQIYYGMEIPFNNRVIQKYNEYTENSPFFEFWVSASTNGYIDGVPTLFQAGINRVDLTAYSEDVTIEFDSANDSTFDDSFDETFTNILTNPIIIQRVLCPENGVTLRWLDNWGVWQQKTFNKLNTNTNSDSSTYNWNDQPSNILYSGLRYAEKENSHSIDIQEVCLREEARRVAGIISSEYIHAYDTSTGSWIPVLVSNSAIKIPENRPSTTVNLNLIVQNGN